MLAVKSSKEIIEYSTRWTKYAVKSVEGLSDDWVSGAPSRWDAAFSWLTKCQHSAAQMATTLTRTPMMRYSCRTKVVTVPTPDAALNNEMVRNCRRNDVVLYTVSPLQNLAHSSYAVSGCCQRWYCLRVSDHIILQRRIFWAMDRFKRSCKNGQPQSSVAPSFGRISSRLSSLVCHLSAAALGSLDSRGGELSRVE